MNDNHSQERRDDRVQLAPHRGAQDVELARSIPTSGWGYEDVENSGFDVQQLIGIVKRRRRLIIGTFALIMVLGILATYLSKPVYQAQSRVLVDTTKIPQSSGEFSALDAMTGMASSRNLETQIEVFKSPSVVQGGAPEVVTERAQDHRRVFPAFRAASRPDRHHGSDGAKL